MEKFKYQKKPSCSYSTQFQRSCNTLSSDTDDRPVLRCETISRLFEACSDAGNKLREVESITTKTEEPLSGTPASNFRSPIHPNLENFQSELVDKFSLGNIFNDALGFVGGFSVALEEFEKAFGGNGEQDRRFNPKRTTENYESKKKVSAYSQAGDVEEI